jgi:hypothetical protein
MVTEIELFKLVNAKALCFVIKRRNYVLFINFNFNLMFKRHICYSSQQMFENPNVNLSAFCDLRMKMACCLI